MFFGRFFLIIIQDAFVKLSKQSRCMLIRESFHLSRIIQVFAPLFCSAHSLLNETVEHVYEFWFS